MRIERKTAMTSPVPGTFTDDDPDGSVWAIAAVTGVQDDVGDVIMPGAFRRSLKTRTPKGVLGHDWSRMVARADQVIELMLGDARLPTTLADGSPWPPEAGALLVRGRFNLSTRDGQEAYSNARFYGDSLGYSIGYKVARSRHVRGIRHIDDLDLDEFSPVLHGANRHARLLAVKTGRPADLEVKAAPLATSVPHGTRKRWALTCGVCGQPIALADRPLPPTTSMICAGCVDELGRLADPFDLPEGDDGGETEPLDGDRPERVTAEGAYAESLGSEQEWSADPVGDLVRCEDDGRRWRPSSRFSG